MFAKTSDFKDYIELTKVLEPLGFTQTETPGFFDHGIIKYRFDFTACSIHGAMKVLFDKAAELGIEHQQQIIREALGM